LHTATRAVRDGHSAVHGKLGRRANGAGDDGRPLGHQPTIASVKRAEAAAETRFSVLLARAHALDAAGDRTGCTRALTDAERNYELRPDNSAFLTGN
jgi:hypothetical protein